MSDVGPIEDYKMFFPDLIVEVTSVCDRACVGCYAPNFVSGKTRTQVMTENPRLFLNPDNLMRAFATLSLADAFSSNRTVSFRGGEPTRSIVLPELLTISNIFNCENILETHGRWILEPEAEELEFSRALFEGIAETNTTVKLSFDEMHGLSAESLFKITEILSSRGINWNIAITERSLEGLSSSREKCSFAPNNKIIFQRKVFSKKALFQPELGVIHINGSRTMGLSTRFIADLNARDGSQHLVETQEREGVK